jgi:hypothetical protein
VEGFALGLLKDMGAGTISGWVLVLIGATFLFREWNATRKLSTEDREARRAGYSKQVADLNAQLTLAAGQITAISAENRSLRNDLAALENRHTEYRRLCETQHDEQVEQTRRQADEIIGLKRAIAAGQIAALDAIPPEFVPAATLAAAQATARILGLQSAPRLPARSHRKR